MVDLNRATVVTEEVGEEISNLFEYHRWDEGKTAKGNVVRAALEQAYRAIVNNVPPCPTRTVALRKIVEARMDANAAITHEGKY
jgi:hypothetical protein